MRATRIVPGLTVVAVLASTVLILAGPASATATCTATSSTPTSGGPFFSGRMVAGGSGICHNVYREKITVCLQLYVVNKRSWIDWACTTPSTLAPSDTNVGTEADGGCTVGTAYIVRSKTVMKGLNSSGKVIASDQDIAPSKNGTSVTCRN